jgi:hypothetical protein
MKEKRNAYRLLLGKAEGKGGLRFKWEDNIKIYLWDIG